MSSHSLCRCGILTYHLDETSQARNKTDELHSDNLESYSGLIKDRFKSPQNGCFAWTVVPVVAG